MRLRNATIILLLLIIVTFSNGCSTEKSNQYTLDIESSYQITNSHQVNLTFSVQNLESKALTNIVVEAYLLDSDQNTSQNFVYLDHRQITLGVINPDEKTNEYSIIVGKEKPESDYSTYTYLKASSAEGSIGSATSDVFSVSAYSAEEYFEQIYCKKIDPYNMDVRMAASEAVRAHPGTYSIDQLLDIYDWVKSNINYLNVPISLPVTPYSPSETLTTKSGDCKNQAVLIASMIESIGGSARVVGQPSCQHAYTIVYFTNSSSDIQDYVDTIFYHYFPCKGGFICGGKCWSYPSGIGAWCDGSNAVESDSCSPGEVGFTDEMCHSCPSPDHQTLILEEGEGGKCRDSSGFTVNWFNYNNGKWVIFDPAGGYYPGDTIPDCLSGNQQRYFMDSCIEPPE